MSRYEASYKDPVAQRHPAEYALDKIYTTDYKTPNGKNCYLAYRGQPIFAEHPLEIDSGEQNEIWGWWTEDRAYSTPFAKIHTGHQLIGMSPFPNSPYRNESNLEPMRVLEIHFYRGVWYTQGNVCQADMDDCPGIAMNPLSGPENVCQALDLLLNDKHFLDTVRSGSGNDVATHLGYIRDHFSRRRTHRN